MIKFLKAKLENISSMQKLVSPEIESGVILERSDDEIATNIRSYTLVFNDNELIAFCALHVHSPFLGEIRSLIVKEDARGKSVGKNLVLKLLDEGKELGLQKVLSLTYEKSFFQRLDFVEIPKESLPEHKIWADCIKCKHFPICNEVSLIKNL